SADGVWARRSEDALPGFWRATPDRVCLHQRALASPNAPPTNATRREGMQSDSAATPCQWGYRCRGVGLKPNPTTRSLLFVGRGCRPERRQPLGWVLGKVVVLDAAYALGEEAAKTGHCGGARKRRLQLLVLGRTRAGGDQLSDDHVLLQTSHEVGARLDGGIGEHPRRLLEGSGRQPGIG